MLRSGSSARGVIKLTADVSMLCKVFRELRLRAPDLLPRRMLDFGAGPGTALWAATEVCTVPACVAELLSLA